MSFKYTTFECPQCRSSCPYLVQNVGTVAIFSHHLTYSIDLPRYPVSQGG